MSHHCTVGDICELEVCADLLKRGWHVFRSVSQSAGCDLVAVGERSTLLFEVRAARRKDSGAFVAMRAPRGRYDVLAMVAPDGAIKYLPGPDAWEDLVTKCHVLSSPQP